jgi:hypothetical protein
MLVEDRKTWLQIVKEGKGNIYNDFGTHFPGNSPSWNTKESNKLHKSSCPHIKRMTYKDQRGPNKYFFNSKQEAIEWLNQNRQNEGYTLCKSCKP